MPAITLKHETDADFRDSKRHVLWKVIGKELTKSEGIKEGRGGGGGGGEGQGN